ncbi:MAG: thioesterase family protein [Bermanella sp.]
MSRKIIELPSDFHFSTDYSVLFTDINSANHMGADRVLPIALEAQMRFIKRLGYDDTIVFEGAGLIMVHSEIQYISETHYADQLTVELAVVNMAAKNLDFVYRIYNNSRQQETARLKVNMLFFDYSTQSVTQVPAGFKARMASIV